LSRASISPSDERRFAAKPLGEVEHHVGRLGAQPRDELLGVVAEAEHADLMAFADQRARDVELRLVGRLDLLFVILRRGRFAVRVEENQHACFLQALL
jgi:hypothetical protein